jgi:hypothetical protein
LAERERLPLVCEVPTGNTTDPALLRDVLMSTERKVFRWCGRAYRHQRAMRGGT